MACRIGVMCCIKTDSPPKSCLGNLAIEGASCLGYHVFLLQLAPGEVL